MQSIGSIHPKILEPLEIYRKWVFSVRVQRELKQILSRRDGPWPSLQDPRHPCSTRSLMEIDHENHRGFAHATHGLHLDYYLQLRDQISLPPDLFAELRQMDRALDDELYPFLNAKHCAVKIFYPAGGFMGWHTNWNSPGYNVMFTYSKTGDGCWRHVDPKGSQALQPNLKNVVQLNDAPGWTCKVSYFGNREEFEQIYWHSAATNEPRLTIGYIIENRDDWTAAVNEIAGVTVRV